jgi:hypothetical protein
LRIKLELTKIKGEGKNMKLDTKKGMGGNKENK